MKALTERLAAIQSKLNAPKGQENKFGGYRYRSCEDILQAVKPLLEGLVLTVNDEIKVIGDRIYVQATATVTDGDHSISTSAYAREALSKKGMDESQITGATSSYARKYALNGLLLIDDNRDADTQDNRNHQEESAELQRQAALQQAVYKLKPTIEAIKAGLASGDMDSAAEAWFELSEDEKRGIWVAPSKGGPFTTKERDAIKSSDFRKAYYGEEAA